MSKPTRIAHRGITFELPAGWEWRESVDRHHSRSAGSWFMLEMHVFALGSGFVAGGLVGAVAGLLFKHWIVGALIGGIGLGTCMLVSSITRSLQGGANLPGIMKGPQDRTALLFVWPAAKDEVPKLDDRLQPGEGEMFVPLGGRVVEQGRLEVDNTKQAWAIRSGPLEAIVDPDWNGRSVPFSADYSVVLPGPASQPDQPGPPCLVVRLYGALQGADDDRTGYEAVARSIRRA